ncbi:cobalamin biosynthesis protein CbiG [Thermus sp. 2.9]|uniref:cobalt-precorrin 5A hydrolase n=1 Tax=Thermus sp. (strain 2.9) TaxID=1577051 RepID=UPI000541CF24|nr:cobalamin biosynthesis protein [Thermus sp. 2.9]KHG65914.1 cobalamin biosynthesis protein CbiG [Thermus sp. 2.9]
MAEVGPLRPERVAVYTLTLPGLKVAEAVHRALPGSTLYVAGKYRGLVEASFFDEPIRDLLAKTWPLHDGHVFVMAAGIVLRAIAPLILDKRVDPAVLVVDLKGRYFVPLLAGHLGGANPLARYLAEALGGEAVLTTGTDSLALPAPDLLAKALAARVPDWKPLKEVSALLVDGRPVGFYSDCVDLSPLARYPTLRLLPRPEPEGVEGMVLFTVKRPFSLPVPALFAHPPALVLGLGCNRGTPQEEIRQEVLRFLEEGGFALEALARLATATLKQDEAGLLAFAQELGLPLRFHPPEVLNAQPIPNPSEVVFRHTGLWGVAEAAVLAEGARLLVEKTKRGNLTLALGVLPLRIPEEALP